MFVMENMTIELRIKTGQTVIKFRGLKKKLTRSLPKLDAKKKFYIKNNL